MRSLEIQRSQGLRGEICVPGDKSITHRAVILGSIAQGTTVVKNFLPSEDCLRTVEAFEQMGIQIQKKGDALSINGQGLRGLSEPPDVLHMGNSGTGFRLLTGLLAGQRFFSVLTGDESLRGRPMRRVIDPLLKMGAEINGRCGGDRAPLSILGRPLKGISYTLPISSAQVKSALLLAGLYADGPTVLVEPSLSRDHTERMMQAFGVPLEIKESTATVRPVDCFKACEVGVPGDLSSAAFFVVGALILSDSELLIRDVGINPTRCGVLEILKRMGGSIRIENRREMNREPVADLLIQSSSLTGIEIEPEWVPQTIDEFPILAVAAAFAEGKTVIHGAGELRVKESDRIATMAGELKKLGAMVEELPDGMIIKGGQPLRGAACDSHGDHRVAMSLAIAGLASFGRTVISDTECIETSFPGFNSLLRTVQVTESGVQNSRKLIIAIDGPAGSGKSSTARHLAKQLNYLYVDTGALYRAVGWKALKEQINPRNEAAIKKMVRGLDIQVVPQQDHLQVILEGQDITDRLRTLDVSRAAAAVATIPAVRKCLIGIQRELGKKGGIVMEGRDIGTVVFPEANLKFFLDASPEARVKRRFRELSEQEGPIDLASTQQEIDIRDFKDSMRSIAPLKQADDAICINSTDLSLENVVKRMLDEVRKKM
jgi:3-phosphoshikimate 1-carboxyvinyltransferase